ncbi:MAG TPA: hypothetical protein PLH25_03150 [Flavobacterium sp.]|nr:hypothetical protein [Flavobacterium sp.]
MKKLYYYFLIGVLHLNLCNTFGQVGIGTTNPSGSSILDVTSIDKGLLIPRVGLTSVTDTATITAPALSLLVYNNGFAPNGFYYWNGTVWVPINSGVSSDWSLTGNNGTTPGTNFLGTINAVDIRIKTNNIDRWNISNANLGQLQSYSLGTAALPTYSFQTDQNTGIYSSGADALDFTTGATARFRIPNANQVHALSRGTDDLPFYSFSADTNTGMYSSNDNVLDFSTQGDSRFRITNTQVLAMNRGSENEPFYSFEQDINTNTGMFSSGENTLDFATWGESRLRIPDEYQILAMDRGTNNDPFYSFNADTNTGIFSSGNDALDFSTNGSARLRIPNANQIHALNLGTAGAPFYSFSADTNTGIFSAGGDILNIATAGTEKVRVEADGDVGIGVTPNASAKMDITATDKGLLIPRVALTARNAAGPITAPATSLLVYNTATSGVAPNNVIPGFYYWNATSWTPFITVNSNDWTITGNSGTGAANFVGTTDAVALKLSTASTERIRVLANGQVVVNNIAAPAATDRFSVYNTTVSDYAINGYSTSNGVGVFGSNTGNGLAIFGQNTGTGAGVYGTSTSATSAGVFGVGNVANGVGTYGTSNGLNGRGVFGNASGGNGIGVLGQSSGVNGTGVFGEANQANRYGVWGLNNNATGIGVYGSSSGNNSNGVSGETTGTSGNGVLGTASGATAIGVRGINNNATGIGISGSSTGVSGIGVIGNSTGNTAAGVVGLASGTTSDGVYGEGSGANGSGVFGINTNASGTGVFGSGNNGTALYLTNGSGGAFTGTNYGSVSFGTNATTGIGVAGAGNNVAISTLANGAGGSFTGLQWAITGISTITDVANDATDRAVLTGNYTSGGSTSDNVYVGARVGGVNYKILGTGGGSVSTTMKTSQGERIMFAPEATENWFFDMGEVQLVNGKAIVQLDPLFTETISDSKPFKVFVQGAENTLGSIKITRNQIEKSFLLEDLGGNSDGIVQFSIYAIWKGKENIRMPELKEKSILKPTEIATQVVTKNNFENQKSESKKQSKESQSNNNSLQKNIEPLKEFEVKKTEFQE